MNAPDKLPSRWPPSRGHDLALQPLPVLPSMLRERRECRIELHKLTTEIGQRYAREAAAGQGFN